MMMIAIWCMKPLYIRMTKLGGSSPDIYQPFGGYCWPGGPGVVVTNVAPMLDCVFLLLVPAGHGSHEARVRPSFIARC